MKVGLIPAIATYCVACLISEAGYRHLSLTSQCCWCQDPYYCTDRKILLVKYLRYWR